MTVTVIVHERGAVDEKYLTLWSRDDADRWLGNPGQDLPLAVAAAGDGEPTWEDAAWQ